MEDVLMYEMIHYKNKKARQWCPLRKGKKEKEGVS